MNKLRSCARKQRAEYIVVFRLYVKVFLAVWQAAIKRHGGAPRDWAAGTAAGSECAAWVASALPGLPSSRCCQRSNRLTAANPFQMHKLVRDLYRRLLWVGKDYPKGLPFVRTKAKEAFFKHAAVTEEEELFRLVATGRWWVKELIGLVQLRKYRALRRAYGDASSGVEGALERRFDEELVEGGAAPQRWKA